VQTPTGIARSDISPRGSEHPALSIAGIGLVWVLLSCDHCHAQLGIVRQAQGSRRTCDATADIISAHPSVCGTCYLTVSIFCRARLAHLVVSAGTRTTFTGSLASK